MPLRFSHQLNRPITNTDYEPSKKNSSDMSSFISQINEKELDRHHRQSSIHKTPHISGNLKEYTTKNASIRSPINSQKVNMNFSQYSKQPLNNRLISHKSNQSSCKSSNINSINKIHGKKGSVSSVQQNKLQTFT